MKSNTQKMTMVTMLTAMAIATHFLESMIPVVIVFPGVHLGLANVFGIVALFMFGPSEMLQVNLLRVLLANLLNGKLFSYPFLMSLFGVLLSTAMVLLFRRATPLSIIGLNCVSATFHGVGQIIAVILITRAPQIVSYLGVMVLLAIPTGLVTGYIAQLILKRFRKGEVQ